MAQSFKQCRIRGKISASTTTWPHLTTRCGSVWSWALNQIKPWEFGIVIIWLMIIWWILMVIIWLMMANNNLVGGWPTPLKNDGVSESQLGYVGMIIPFPMESHNPAMFQSPPARFGCYIKNIKLKPYWKSSLPHEPKAKQSMGFCRNHWVQVQPKLYIDKYTFCIYT